MKHNDQLSEIELAVLLRELGQVLVALIPGDVVELGCYKGLTSLELAKALKAAGSDKKLYVYDSFEGLPEKAKQDQSPAGDQFRAGKLSASKQDVIKLFKKAGLHPPVITKAWFKDIKQKDLPETIAFAFLDGDFYESIKDSLEAVWPHLAHGATVLVDDYQNEALPGTRKAVDEWLRTHPGQLSVESSLAIIRPA